MWSIWRPPTTTARVNDLTLRERGFRKDIPELGADWLASKDSPTFLPTGPALVPSGAVPDPSDLRIALRLNGEVRQDESTKNFEAARIIAHYSDVSTLLPGDLVLTGSPAGEGMTHGRFLRHGDVMTATISGLGRQVNRCVNER
ncbi:fumarylacetoacetate hydrolase family protein [Actinomadura welshii]|uniref:fumarylacetoacetate hydrolase family protein n=1 Tax=Actinomadura welshii TaxID=3103817 RepID=UPI0003AD47F5|nr:fumarylacetoacetate hydrolase family protein [Actinomadura madurae]